MGAWHTCSIPQSKNPERPEALEDAIQDVITQRDFGGLFVLPVFCFILLIDASGFACCMGEYLTACRLFFFTLGVNTIKKIVFGLFAINTLNARIIKAQAS